MTSEATETKGKYKTIADSNGKGYVGNVRAYAAGTSGKITQHADFKNTRYGVYTSNDGVTTLFVQGNKPSEIDSKIQASQVYTLTGNAFYGKDGVYTPMDAEAVVNFNIKKVRVDIKELGSSESKLNFGGSFDDGNGTALESFSGTKNGVNYSASFYGPLGRDLAGTFYETEGANAGNNGVFGVSNRERVGTATESRNNTTTLADY